MCPGSPDGERQSPDRYPSSGEGPLEWTQDSQRELSPVGGSNPWGQRSWVGGAGSPAQAAQGRRTPVRPAGQVELALQRVGMGSSRGGTGHGQGKGLRAGEPRAGPPQVGPRAQPLGRQPQPHSLANTLCPQSQPWGGLRPATFSGC